MLFLNKKSCKDKENTESKIHNLLFSIFVSMKSIHLTILFILVNVLTACPGSSSVNAKKKLFKNHMDLPDPIKTYHNGIHFMLSDLFETNYDSDFVLKDDATLKVNYDLDLNFSVETFSKLEAESFRFAFSDETDLLNAVHDNYALRRQKSLHQHFSSIKKAVPKEVGFDGVIQTIEGEEFYQDGKLLYLMATIEIDNKYHVFQLIGKKENMGYLYDDFLDILNSIEK